MADRNADAAQMRRVLATNPNDRVSWHNLAAAEGDLGRVKEAEAAARRAIALGITAPETRLVLARALQSQRRLEEARRAFEEAIALRPSYVDAHRDLAQLLWMTTGKADGALARLDAVLRKEPRLGALHLIRSIVLETAGDFTASLAAVNAGLTHCPREPALLRQATHLHLTLGDAATALALARDSARIDSRDVDARIAVCEALLALGELDETGTIIAALVPERPFDQYILALQATLWRLQGDPRYGELCDYGALVQSRELPPPAGWNRIADFMAELAGELTALHGFRAHPFKQSVRGGSQLPLQSPELAHPLIAALFGSVHAVVTDYLRRLGSGVDPFRGRNTGRFGITGAWSVRLTSGGYHADHVHPQGWLSSACYIATPECCAREDAAAEHAGWLRLGAPGIATQPPLAADMYVRPQPGSLVLFPAYVWHGVVPFVSEQPRLSVAFDAVPL